MSISTSKEPFMLRKILLASALASLAIAGTASAVQAPTLGPLTVIKAGQKTPVDIGGNNLHQGTRIRKGTELRRWLVTMHGRSNANITLKCGPGAKHVGLGLPGRREGPVRRLEGQQVLPPYDQGALLPASERGRQRRPGERVRVVQDVVT
jgi:hypothetical protein